MITEDDPIRFLLVRAINSDPCVPWQAKQRTDDSDSHSVPSHPVAPDRTIDVYATSPRLPPCTVTDADPVPAWLTRRIWLTDPTSTEYASVMLRRRCRPAVSVSRLVPCRPCPALHRTDVSDSHSVPSHAVLVYRACWLYHVAHSNPAPCTVRLVEPVPALLVFLAALTIPKSVDILYICDPVPTRSPDVMATLFVPRHDA